MAKDIERGLGNLMGHEEPETRARRVRAVRDLIRRSASKVTHSDTSSLDLSSYYDMIYDPPKETPKVTPKDKFGHTKAQKDRMIFKQITKPKEKYFYEPWHNRKVERITKPTEAEIQDKEFWGAFNNSEKMLKYINKWGDGPKIEAPKKYPVIPKDKQPEVNVKPERNEKAINSKTKEKTNGQI